MKEQGRCSATLGECLLSGRITITVVAGRMVIPGSAYLAQLEDPYMVSGRRGERESNNLAAKSVRHLYELSRFIGPSHCTAH